MHSEFTRVSSKRHQHSARTTRWCEKPEHAKPTPGQNKSDEPSQTKEEEKLHVEDTEVPDTDEHSDDYEDTDVNSASECTIIPAAKTDADTPATNDVPTSIEKVGCAFVTA